jgi:glycosyltransferase involved in cell wall biosynthesis
MSERRTGTIDASDDAGLRKRQETLRLGYLVPEFPSQTHAFFWREVSALRQIGCEVFLISTFAPDEDACCHAFGKSARAETAYLLPPSIADWLGLLAPPRRLVSLFQYVAGLRETPLRKKAYLSAAGAAAVRLRALCRQHGIAHVHVHSCGNSAHIAALTQRFGGASYSLTLHGDLSVYGGDHAQKMRFARFVSVVTKPLQSQVLEKTHMEPERVPVITMGVDTEKFQTKRDYEARGPIRMITVGRLNPSKGHRYALEAMKKALTDGCDLRYTIVGEGSHRAGIEEILQELGLARQVDLTGTLSEDRVRDLLRESDVFLLTSVGLGEAAPVAVMEAMACGLPVICSRIGGTGDMICDGQDGLLVEQYDVEGIHDALVRLTKSADYRREIGQAARKTAEDMFDFRHTSRRLFDRIAAA